MKPNSSLLAIHDLVNSWCRELGLARSEKPTVEEISQAVGRLGSMCRQLNKECASGFAITATRARTIDALKVALREMVR